MQDMIHYLKIKMKIKIKKQFNVQIIKICQSLIKLINSLNIMNRTALCQLKWSQKYY